MFRRCAWLCVVAVGCGASSAPPVTKTAMPVVPIVAKVEVKEDPKVAEFKAAVAGFIKEARATAKAMDLSLTTDESQKLADKTKDLYVHLPDAPPPYSENPELGASLKDIQKATALNVIMTKAENEAIQVGAVIGERNAPKAAQTIRELCAKIEAAINSPND